MFWWWGPGWGWIGGLISAALWIAIIIGAIVLLRRELPDLQHRFSAPPALRVLEERYAKGEITREEFLHRREVLLNPHLPTYEYPSYQAPPEAGPPSPPPGAPPPPKAREVFDPPSEPESGGEEAGSGAMSSTYEPPREPPSEAPPAGAEPTLPLPPSGSPE